jgi:hypothetical protein
LDNDKEVRMAKSVFDDRTHKPSGKEVLAVLGRRRKDWDSLNQYMWDNYRERGGLIFGGKNYGWAFQFRRSGKPLLALFPGKDAFIALVVVGRSLLAKAQSLKLGKHVKQLLAVAHRYPEGVWLYIDITSARDILDVQKLVALKARPSQGRKAAAAPSKAA